MNNISDKIKTETESIINELLLKSGLKKGDILVIGCSSSEVAGASIGTFSSKDIGACIFDTAYSILKPAGIYLACQCCEHLNRALIVGRECAITYNLPMVNVVPALKAGGSFATAAYNNMDNPVAVESISADAGIDIGDTLIGMHLKNVAVPVRLSLNTIGSAHVVCARTRLKYIGGPRASYMEEN